MFFQFLTYVPYLDFEIESLGTSYKLSKIYFLPSESGAGLVYKVRIARLIKDYHSRNEFKEGSVF